MTDVGKGKERKGRKKEEVRETGRRRERVDWERKRWREGERQKRKWIGKTISQRCAEAVVETSGSRRCVRGPSDHLENHLDPRGLLHRRNPFRDPQSMLLVPQHVRARHHEEWL
jgi:hypothetical protein